MHLLLPSAADLLRIHCVVNPNHHPDDPLLKCLQEQEKAVKVIRTKQIELSEHCDFYWVAGTVEWLFEDLVSEFVL